MAAETAYKYDYAYGYEPAYVPEKAPVTLPEQEKKPELKKVKKTKKDIAKQNERATNRKMAVIVAVMCVFFAVFALACNSMATRESAKRSLDVIKEEYAFCETQNRELKVKLNKIISAENIDRIAVEKLGLVKVSSGNEIYFDSHTGNQVIYSKGK